MKTVRCISRSVNGMTAVAVPEVFGEFEDGKTYDLDDDAADLLLGNVPGRTANPCFEEVKPAPAPAPSKSTKGSDAAASTTTGGNA